MERSKSRGNQADREGSNRNSSSSKIHNQNAGLRHGSSSPGTMETRNANAGGGLSERDQRRSSEQGRQGDNRGDSSSGSGRSR